ncbi:TraR/DksA C4-type zinc finger protein [Congregibacter variabilis]|uniref:TraR/DksA C4-type zinc finger protein n=1 Tax=Congregibacter variabilis TaxID=3081200 RepID=A0ABZ0I2F5_9GAMM|nr:TraR/DksA C4-type zinc finger protein [Congregibacter sp. IMCC43200]
MDITESQRVLEQRLLELEGRLAKLKRDAAQEHSSDSAEQAQERENDEVVDAIGVETRDSLAAVKAALQRIEEGNYGKCMQCGGDIAADRLKVMPEATHCMGCAA